VASVPTMCESLLTRKFSSPGFLWHDALMADFCACSMVTLIVADYLGWITK
jgi:hypothetical protein